MRLCLTIIEIKVCIIAVSFKVNHLFKIDNSETRSRIYEYL